MRLLGLCLVAATVGSAGLHLKPLFSTDGIASHYRKKADAVLCRSPFQLRKAIVAAHQSDSDRVWSLACVVLTAGSKVRLGSMHATKCGPWKIELISDDGPASAWWGYADQFEADED